MWIFTYERVCVIWESMMDVIPHKLNIGINHLQYVIKFSLVKKFKPTFPKILLTISLYASPTTELSLTADLQSSTLAEWMGTYLSWEDPASRTLLNRWRLEFSDSLYMNVCLMSEWSFKANCWSDPDFFHLCITHMPALTGNKEMCKTISAYSTAAKIFT